jgi:glycine cleavage system transcriptional repressor
MAANRVGILAALSNALDELGGNIHELNQAVMGRYFAFIMAADFPRDRHADVIVDHIQAVCRPFGIEVTLKSVETDEIDEEPLEPTPSNRYLLAMGGTDRPGILRTIAHRLAQDGIDVVDLHGARSHSSPMFDAWMELAVPVGVDVLRLLRDLEAYGQTAEVTFTMQHRAVLTAISHPEPLRS